MYWGVSSLRKIFIFIVTIISFSASADVVVDLSKIKVGQYEIVNWNNLPVIVFHRTENQIQYLKLKIDRPTNTASESIYAKFYGEFIASALLEGDDINKKHMRSLDEKWFVVIGFAPESGVALRVHESALMDPTDGTFYDLTGRVVDESSNKKDLSMPKYKIYDEKLTIFTSSGDITPPRSSVNSKDLPEKQIIDSISLKEFKIAKSLIIAHPYIVKIPKINTAILAAATIYGDKELLETAIKNGANINVLFENNSTPLNTALVLNNMDVAEYLIKNGASLQIVCHPKYPTRCSTPTLEVAKMIEGTEAIVKKWISIK